MLNNNNSNSSIPPYDNRRTRSSSPQIMVNNNQNWSLQQQQQNISFTEIIPNDEQPSFLNCNGINGEEGEGVINSSFANDINELFSPDNNVTPPQHSYSR